MGTQGSNRKTGGVSDAVGVRFNPTPEEMVDHYLKLKKQDKGFKSDHIAEFDVCNLDPWDLAARIPSDDMVWYFFSPKEYKYINSTRYNRTTPGGQWKMTGKERPVKARLSKAVIGKKRTLTFYQRCGPQRKLKKTNWVRHEYSLIDSEANSNPKLRQKDFVLNRMKKEFDEEDTSIGEVELGSYSVSNVEDHAAAAVTPESQDYSSSTFLSSGYIEPGDVLQANGTNYDCNAIQSPFGDNHYSYIDKNDISNYDKGDLFTMSDFENELLDDMSLIIQVYQNLLVCDLFGDFMHTDVFMMNVCLPQEEDLELAFHLPQLEDYTLEPPMNKKVGDVLHDNNYVC
ncbi:NAC domain-containing protein 94 [Pyrus ussuriensis x Pyrus communis]|uniref:NAC domain-containing protein 94 n=1 Tax=Pyrus ussuriensis x Pyrus communis TaxID=2448454 RepID=A0A5N5F4M3_9ROSA|nr:NAC domain-containing protein 94 [Pyrus ussuriensis x Pyrus communis]